MTRYMLTLTLLTSGFAAAQEDYFLGGSVGYLVGHDQLLSSNPDGYDLGVHAGINISDWSILLGYRDNGSLKNHDLEVNTKLIDLMALYNIDLSQSWSLGVGGGVSYWDMDKRLATTKQSADGFSPGAMVKLNYDLSKRWSTGVSYQYTHQIGKQGDTGKYDTSAAHVYLSYKIGGNANSTESQGLINEPPQQVHEPIEAPKVCSSQQEVLPNIVFEFDSAELSTESLKVFQEADLKSIIQAASDYQILVEGYANPVGSRLYNLALSQQRANAVSEYLKNQGIENIRTMGMGADMDVASRSNQEKKRVQVRVSYTICK